MSWGVVGGAWIPADGRYRLSVSFGVCAGGMLPEVPGLFTPSKPIPSQSARYILKIIHW